MAMLKEMLEPFEVQFVYAIPPTELWRIERAIAKAAVTEVLTRMIADADKQNGYGTVLATTFALMEGSFACGVGRDGDVTYVQSESRLPANALSHWIKRYLPTPAPTADEGETE